MDYVIVLTNTELGWDCVVSVHPYTLETYEAMSKYCEENDTYVIHEKVLTTFDPEN